MDALVIAGFLGSGKTTLIRRLADLLPAVGWSRPVIVENEVGQVDLDGAFLSGHGLSVRQLPNGCICCSLKGDLVSTMATLKEELDPDLVVIEPSGVASPGQVQGILADPATGLSSLRTWVVADGSRLERSHFGSIYFVRERLRHADATLVSKLDLLTPAAAHELLAGIAADFPMTPVADATDLDAVTAMLKRPAAPSATGHAWGKPDPAASAGIAVDLPRVDPAGLVAAFTDLAAHLATRYPQWLGHLKVLVTVDGVAAWKGNQVDAAGDLACETLTDATGPARLLAAAIVVGAEHAALASLLGDWAGSLGT